MRRFSCLWLLLGHLLIAADPPATVLTLRSRLDGDISRHLADPPTYARLVAVECGRFPEGDLFPYTMPVLAWAGIAHSDPARAPALRLLMAPCIDLATTAVARRVGVTEAELARLPDYRRHATYLGQLALALGCWRLAGGDDRYEVLHERLCAVLLAALERSDGAQLASFPTYSWTFDTIPCLVALRLRDRQRGEQRATAAIKAHLAWLDRAATDPATGLPVSEVGPNGPTRPPRGCDLSWRIALLAQVDRAAARAAYARYHAAMWHDAGPFAGFREYPAGRERIGDLDSGPIVQGIGMTATGFGIAAAHATGDDPTTLRLGNQTAAVPTLRRLALAIDPAGARQALGSLPDDPAYATGFLFGDVCLFYAVAWTDWGTAFEALP